MRLFLFGVLVCAFSGVVWVDGSNDTKDLKDFEQVMEKGTVPAIRDPQFVNAGQASLTDRAFVIGVSHGETAQAFSVNLMNKFSVVNGEVGGKPVAVVWDPLANSVVVYHRAVNGKALTLEASGALYRGSMVLEDDETHTLWSAFTGKAIAGPQKGSSLQALPYAETMLWTQWKARHPQTQVLQVNGQTHIDTNPYLAYLKSPNPSRPIKKPDKRMAHKTPVFGFVSGGKAYAIEYKRQINGWKGKAGKEQIFVYRSPKSSLFQSTKAYYLTHEGSPIKLKGKDDGWSSAEHGSLDPDKGAFADGVQLKPVNGKDTFWFVWSQFHPKSKILNPQRRARHSDFEKPRTDDGSGDSILIDN